MPLILTGGLSKAKFDPKALAGIQAGMGLAGIMMETTYLLQAFTPDGDLKWEATAKNRVVTAGLNKLLDATFKTGLTTPAWYIGLVGSGITDGAITASDATLTSASNPFTSGDVGRAIIVRGAGTSGADLVTTIASFTNSGSVELTDNAATTVTGAGVLWDARAADTMASHSPWSESSAYSQSNRPAFTAGSISGGSVDNSGSPASFSINADNTRIFGAFLCDNNTKGGSSGVLYGMAPFASPGSKTVDNGDTLAVTTTLTASAA
jgi:hypothetical protein